MGIKQNRGGARKGAGRKRIYVERMQTFACRLPAETIQKIKKLAAEKNITVRELIINLITNYKKKL